MTRVLGDYGFQSGPDMNTGEWLIGLETTPPVCSGQAPPCLPAPLPSIPFNQYIKTTGEVDSILKPITDNWGPRAGVAWQLDPSMVLRSGYALLWDSMVSRSQYGQHQYESWGWPQFSGIDTGNMNRSPGPIQPIGNIQNLPFLAPRPAPWNSEGFYNDPNRKNAYSHQWHVDLQREISRNADGRPGLCRQLQRAHGIRRPAAGAAAGRRRCAPAGGSPPRNATRCVRGRT